MNNPDNDSARRHPQPRMGHGRGNTRLALAVAVILASAVRAAPASAAESSQKDDDRPTKENTVTVEGQKDKPWKDTSNVDLVRTENDAQPYFMLDAATIEHSGAANVEDLLRNRMSMAGAGSPPRARQDMSQQGSTSDISLRGLGANKTLILINGRRLGGATQYGNSYQPDVNAIPLSAIERVEVLPNSASGIYGGSAIGGVINIVLKRNYSGSDLRVSYESPWDNDAAIRTFSLSSGHSLREGRTNLTFSLQKVDGEDMLWGDRREVTERYLKRALANQPDFLDGVRLGSTPNIKSADGSDLVLRDGRSLGAPMTHVAPGISPLTPLADQYAALLANAGSWNEDLPMTVQPYGGLNRVLVKAPDTTSLLATVRHQFTAKLEGFLEFGYSQNTARSQYNEGFYWDYRIGADVPTNPFNEDVDVRWPNTYSGLMRTTTTTKNLATGLVAQLPRSWTAMLDYSVSLNKYDNVSLGGYDSSGINGALASGAYNPFVDTMLYYQNLDRYGAQVFPPKTESFVHDVNLRAHGPIFPLPGANMARLAAGLEYRREGYDTATGHTDYFTTDSNDNSFTFYGKEQDIKSLYLELTAPFITAKNEVPLIDTLELQVAMRHERYSVERGTTNNEYYYNRVPVHEIFIPNGPGRVGGSSEYTSTSPTFALKYQPVRQLILRASYGEAFLPPSFTQLRPNILPNANPQTIFDPVIGQSYGVQTLSGGNPDLDPLSAESVNFGVIWQPDGGPLDGLRVSVDRYRITQNDVIGSLDAQYMVGDEATYGFRITRDPVTGRITLVNTSLLNLTKYVTKGWDLTLDYFRPTPVGIFGISVMGTFIDGEERQLTVNGPMIDYANYVNEGGPSELRGNVLLSWEHEGWYATWDMRYFDSYYIYGAPGAPYYRNDRSRPLYTFWTQAQGSNTADAQLYHDLMVSRRFNPDGGLFGNTTVRLGIKNVFDEAPPFDAYNSGGYYSGFGDIRMRSFYIDLQKRF